MIMQALFSCDALNPVTAISLYLDWLDQLVTLCIPPKHMSKETAQEIVSQFDNCLTFDNETEMFEVFFQLIEDSDVMMVGTQNGMIDPYTLNRVTRVMSKDDTRKFCLLGHLPSQEHMNVSVKKKLHMIWLVVYIWTIYSYTKSITMNHAIVIN